MQNSLKCKSNVPIYLQLRVKRRSLSPISNYALDERVEGIFLRSPNACQLLPPCTKTKALLCQGGCQVFFSLRPRGCQVQRKGRLSVAKGEIYKSGTDGIQGGVDSRLTFHLLYNQKEKLQNHRKGSREVLRPDLDEYQIHKMRSIKNGNVV